MEHMLKYLIMIKSKTKTKKNKGRNLTDHCPVIDIFSDKP